MFNMVGVYKRETRVRTNKKINANKLAQYIYVLYICISNN